MKFNMVLGRIISLVTFSFVFFACSAVLAESELSDSPMKLRIQATTSIEELESISNAIREEVTLLRQNQLELTSEELDFIRRQARHGQQEFALLTDQEAVVFYLNEAHTTYMIAQSRVSNLENETSCQARLACCRGNCTFCPINLPLHRMNTARNSGKLPIPPEIEELAKRTADNSALKPGRLLLYQ